MPTKDLYFVFVRTVDGKRVYVAKVTGDDSRDKAMEMAEALADAGLQGAGAYGPEWR